MRPTELLKVLELFFSIYQQMFPRNTLLYSQHRWELLTMMEEGKDIRDIIEYDDVARRHYIGKRGKSWNLTDVAAQRRVYGIMGRRPYKESMEIEKLRRAVEAAKTKPTYHTKPSTPKSAQKPNATKSSTNPNAAKQAGCCFLWNSPKGCVNDPCQYKHKCTKCFAPHKRQACDNSGPGLPPAQ